MCYQSVLTYAMKTNYYHQKRLLCGCTVSMQSISFITKGREWLKTIAASHRKETLRIWFLRFSELISIHQTKSANFSQLTPFSASSNLYTRWNLRVRVCAVELCSYALFHGDENVTLSKTGLPSKILSHQEKEQISKVVRKKKYLHCSWIWTDKRESRETEAWAIFSTTVVNKFC